MTPKSKWIAAGVVAFVIVCLANNKPDPAPPATAPATSVAAHPTTAAPAPVTALDASIKPVYTLESSEDCTVDRDEPCRRISIEVPKGESRAQIASDLAHAAQEAKASYGTVRGIAFASAVGTDKNNGYSAGRAVWGTNENTDRIYTAEAPSVDYVDDYFKPEAPASFLVVRISEARRKRIYFESGMADDKATHEADAAYPTTPGDNAEQEDQSQRNFEPNMKMNRSLTEKYEAQVQHRYHLSDDQSSAISLEGMEKHWPTPDETKD